MIDAVTASGSFTTTCTIRPRDRPHRRRKLARDTRKRAHTLALNRTAPTAHRCDSPNTRSLGRQQRSHPGVRRARLACAQPTGDGPDGAFGAGRSSEQRAGGGCMGCRESEVGTRCRSVDERSNPGGGNGSASGSNPLRHVFQPWLGAPCVSASVVVLALLRWRACNTNLSRSS